MGVRFGFIANFSPLTGNQSPLGFVANPRRLPDWARRTRCQAQKSQPISQLQAGTNLPARKPPQFFIPLPPRWRLKPILIARGGLAQRKDRPLNPPPTYARPARQRGAWSATNSPPDPSEARLMRRSSCSV